MIGPVRTGSWLGSCGKALGGGGGALNGLACGLLLRGSLRGCLRGRVLRVLRDLRVTDPLLSGSPHPKAGRAGQTCWGALKAGPAQACSAQPGSWALPGCCPYPAFQKNCFSPPPGEKHCKTCLTGLLNQYIKPSY